MPLLSRKVDYALLILSYLHHRAEGGCARAIAARFGLSRAFTANILKGLCQKGFVRSQRGMHGGYVLARPASAVCLCEVLEALDEPFHLAQCNRAPAEEESACSLAGTCPVRSVVAEVDRRIRDILRAVTLAELFRATEQPAGQTQFGLEVGGAMLKLPIYLDNNATTRVDPRVLEAMLPYFGERYGNAASRHHAFGREAEAAVEQARAAVANLIGANPNEIVFTSGATESDNLALKGVMAMARPRGDHFVTALTEHHAVLDPAKRLEREGARVTFLPVDREGRISPEQVESALTERTVLVSLMAANNEVGTLLPLGAIGEVCKRRGVLFHTDAVQAVGKVAIDVEEMGIDLLSLSAHKMYGPKGVGALYVRRRGPTVRLAPLFDGGGHERGRRSGTLAVPLIVGLGRACELCQEEMAAEQGRLTALRERLRQGIQEQLEGVTLNGHASDRLPGNLNLSFAWVNGLALLMGLRDVAVSSGSACTSANPEPSYVLRALGVEDELAQSSLRFGLGRFNTAEEVEHASAEVVRVVRHLRQISPAYEMHKQRAGLVH